MFCLSLLNELQHTFYNEDNATVN